MGIDLEPLTGHAVHKLAHGVGENPDSINLRQQNTRPAQRVSVCRGQSSNMTLNLELSLIISIKSV